MKTSNKGRQLIKHYESLHDGDLSQIGLQPKEDPSGVWTIGWGHALRGLDGKWLKGVEGFSTLRQIYPDYLTITEEEANSILRQDLEYFENYVRSKLDISLMQHEFDALVSHTYNTGGSETLFSLINESPDHTLLNFDKIGKWWTSTYTTANGKYLRGLELRRKTEFNLFATGVLSYAKI